MGPRWYNRVLASSWYLSCGVGAVAAELVLFVGLKEGEILVFDLEIIVWVIVSMIAAGAFGWWIGNLIIWPLLGRVAVRAQGWPFGVGERVRVLRGPHKNKEGLVLELSDDPYRLILDLGSDARRRGDDLIFAWWVCRAERLKSNGEVD